MADLLEYLTGFLQRPDALFELLVLWASVYVILRFLRGSLGLGILRGLLSAGVVVYVVVYFCTELFGFELPHLELLLKPSLQILILAAVILFQPELRRAFIRIGENPAFERLTKATTSRGHAIAEAVERLSRRRVGALIAIERSIGLRGFTEGAVRLNADVDSPLLESIFQPGGPLHDGAVLIRGPRIIAAGCLFPLSENPEISQDHGTRHRAALGVTEESDALAVVVSEETGNISFALRGELKKVDSSRTLARIIDETLATPQMPGESSE
jgi:diadenylate cyclase